VISLKKYLDSKEALLASSSDLTVPDTLTASELMKDLLARADAAMYENKAQSRQRRKLPTPAA
jgi:hypothetical protein